MDVYRVVHHDFRRDMYTLERTGLARFWTPYIVVTGQMLAASPIGRGFITMHVSAGDA